MGTNLILKVHERYTNNENNMNHHKIMKNMSISLAVITWNNQVYNK